MKDTSLLYGNTSECKWYGSIESTNYVDNKLWNLNTKQTGRSTYRFKDIFLIITACLLSYTAYANFLAFVPILPQEALKKDMSEELTGILIGSGNLIMFLMTFITGLMVSKISPKLLFYSGAFVYSISSILFGTLGRCPDGVPFVVMCFFTRCIQSFGFAVFMASCYSIIAVQFPIKVTFYVSIIEMFCGAGMMSSPPLSGILYQYGGYGLPFYIFGGLGILLSVCSLFCFHPTKDMPKSSSKSFQSFLLRPACLMITYAVFCVNFAFSFVQPTISIRLLLFNVEEYQIGFIFFVIPATYSVVGPIVGYFCSKKGYIMIFLQSGSLVGIIVFIFMGPAPFLPITPTLWLMILANVGVGLLFALMYVTSFTAYISLAVEDGYENNYETKGLIAGLILSSFSLGGFAGASIAGFLVDSLGFQWASFSIACPFVLNSIFLTIFSVSRRSKVSGQIFQRHSYILTLNENV